MTGLLLKDFYSLRSYLFKQILLMSIIYILIAIFMQSVAFLTPMMVLGISMVLISSFSADEASKWDSYAHTLPLSAAKIVGAKYILFLGALLFGSAVVSAVCIILDSFLFQQGAFSVVLSAAAVAGLYMLVSAVMLPIFFKYGAEKGRMLMTLVYMVPFFIVVWAGSYLGAVPDLQIWIASLPWTLIAVLAVAALALICILSFFISVRLYKSKEF